MAQPTKDALISAVKSKTFASFSVIVTIVIPIVVFLLSITLPASQTDIHRLESTDESIRLKVETVADAQVKSLSVQIENLEKSREDYFLQRMQVTKQLDNAMTQKTGDRETDLYLTRLAQIDKNIRDTEQKITDLREKQKKVETTVF